MADRDTPWRTSDAHRDLCDALAACGHPPTTASLDTLTIEQRKAVEREWTRRMQVRCGIDPMRTPGEVKADKAREADLARRDERAARVIAAAETPAERKVAALYADGLQPAAIARELERSAGAIRSSIAALRKKATGAVSTAQERRETALRLHREEGLTQVAIAERLGVTWQRVGQILRSEGVRTLPDQRRQQAERLFHEGQPRRVIAARMGIQVRQVNRLLRESQIFDRAPRVPRQEAA